jgi:hypothetical protein
MTIRHAVAALGALAGAALAAPAQEPAAPAAPRSAHQTAVLAAAALARGATAANVVPGTFRAHLVVDKRFKPGKDPEGREVRDPRNRTGNIHCLVCENGLSPVVAIFVRADLKGATADGGLGKLIKGTDALLPKYRADKLAAFVTYLKLDGGPKLVTVKGADGGDEKVEAAKEYPDDEKRDAYAKEVSDYAAALAVENVPFGLAPTTAPSIAAFGIEEGTPVTVIIYNRLRMVRRWELKLDDITDEKVGEILAATEQMIVGKKK